MKSSIKRLEKSIIELTIEEDKENILKFKKRVLDNIRKNANIKGFRKGANIPEEVIVRNYGEEKIFAMIVDEALNELYLQALRENNILPVTQGEIKEIKSQDPLVIVIRLEVFPEVEIDKKYKKIKISKTKVEVSDDEVKKALEEIQKRFTRFAETEESYTSRMGDRLYITTQGYDSEGKKLDNTYLENYPIILGSKTLISSFEEGLINRKAGEKFELDIAFPEDYYDENFKGKKVKFEVEINKIEKPIVPEFTPEFIKKLRGKDLDFDGFKELIRQELIEAKETNARIKDENALIDELLKISKVDFGEHLLKNQISKVYQEIKKNIIESGMKVYDYINSLGMSEEDYIEYKVKPIAIRRLQSELILHKLLELEKIQIQEEELNKEIEKILSKFDSEDVVIKLKELYKPNTKYYEELRQRLAYRNLIDSFFE